jgi:hypothetical protein
LKLEKLVIGIVIFGLLTAFTYAVFTLTGAMPSDKNYYAILIAAPIASVMLLIPRTLVITAAIWVFLFQWTADTLTILPSKSVWIVDVIIFVLTIRLLFHVPRCHHPRLASGMYIIGLLAFAMVSALVNHIGSDALAFGLRLGFRYLMLYLVIYHLMFSEKAIARYIKFLFFVGLIQTPIVLAQYFSSNEKMFGDNFTGSFGYQETSGLAMMLLVLISIFLARMVEQEKFKVTYLIAMAWMAVCPIIGEVKFFFLFIPIFAAFMVRDELFRRPAIAIFGVIASLMLFAGAQLVVSKTGGWIEGRDPITYLENLPEVFKGDYEDAMRQNALNEEVKYTHRSFQWSNAIEYAGTSWKYFIFGHGPGSITVSEYIRSNASTLSFFSDMELTSQIGLSMPWLLIEYGFIGTAALLFLLFLVYRRGRVLRRSDNIDYRIYGRVLEGITLLYFVYLLYVQAWQNNPMNMVYWSLAAMFVSLSYRKAAPKQAEGASQPATHEIGSEIALVHTD